MKLTKLIQNALLASVIGFSGCNETKYVDTPDHKYVKGTVLGDRLIGENIDNKYRIMGQDHVKPTNLQYFFYVKGEEKLTIFTGFGAYTAPYLDAHINPGDNVVVRVNNFVQNDESPHKIIYRSNLVEVNGKKPTK